MRNVKAMQRGYRDTKEGQKTRFKFKATERTDDVESVVVARLGLFAKLLRLTVEGEGV